MLGSCELGVLVGDGIGAEIVPPTVAIADAAIARSGGAAVRWTQLPMGRESIERSGSILAAATLQRLELCDGWVMGPHDNASYPATHRAKLNPSGTLRKAFDLFANIRPAGCFAGVNALAPSMDLVVVRQNTEGFYSDRNMKTGRGEVLVTDGVALSTGVFTRHEIERIARTAFELAGTRRHRLAIVHKANVLPLTTGMYLEVCRDLAAAYPTVEVDDFHVDAMAAQLVRDPSRFDVVLAENMFGDILSEVACELAGGLGLAPSLNVGDQLAMAQAAHGAAPDIAGHGVANPTGLLLSMSMLLEWLGRRGQTGFLEASERLVAALTAVLASGRGTIDIGGKDSTESFSDAVKVELGTQDASFQHCDSRGPVGPA